MKTSQGVTIIIVTKENQPNCTLIRPDEPQNENKRKQRGTSIWSMPENKKKLLNFDTCWIVCGDFSVYQLSTNCQQKSIDFPIGRNSRLANERQLK